MKRKVYIADCRYTISDKDIVQSMRMNGDIKGIAVDKAVVQGHGFSLSFVLQTNATAESKFKRPKHFAEETQQR